MYSQIKHYIYMYYFWSLLYSACLCAGLCSRENSLHFTLSFFLSAYQIILVHQKWTWTTGSLTSAFDLFACVYMNIWLMCLLLTDSATTNYSSIADCCWLPVHWCVDFSIYVGRDKPSRCWWPGGCATWSDLAAGQQHRASDHAAHPG